MSHFLAVTYAWASHLRTHHGWKQALDVGTQHVERVAGKPDADEDNRQALSALEDVVLVQLAKRGDKLASVSETTRRTCTAGQGGKGGMGGGGRWWEEEQEHATWGMPGDER